MICASARAPARLRPPDKKFVSAVRCLQTGRGHDVMKITELCGGKINTKVCVCVCVRLHNNHRHHHEHYHHGMVLCYLW